LINNFETMNTPIYVVGSSNTDMVVKAAKLPSPGETVLGGTFLMNPGGKGANQAVAASRLGGKVTFVSCVGNDVFGKKAVQQFRDEKINTNYIASNTQYPSGVALINVDESGENTIVVAPGANTQVSIHLVEAALQSLPADAIVLVQLEIPMESVECVVEQAPLKNARVILNPAPAAKLKDELLKNLYLITPNESEAELLTGIRIQDDDDASIAAGVLHEKGVPNVVITLGAKGALLSELGKSIHIKAPTIDKVTDTTAAGDCFNGAIAVALAEGKDLLTAVTFACHAASISVTRMGAQSSLPNRTEVDDLLSNK
jgi:ribokinase